MNWIEALSAVPLDKLPKVISPKKHAIADYVMAAGAFVAAVSFFKANRKTAGIAALVAGAVEIINPMLTDFPGGVFKVYSFPTHGRVDLGAISMVAGMPKLFDFAAEPESKFFFLHAAAATAIISMTDFGGPEEQAAAEGRG